MKDILLKLILLICIFSSAFAGLLEAVDNKKGEIRVMSFNIRLGVAKDGENRWDLRKELVVKTIREYNPDLLGLQEVFPMQEKYLRENLPHYFYYGRSRLVNPEEGEACSLMFKKDRFKATEKTTFWLSETQDVPGSKS